MAINQNLKQFDRLLVLENPVSTNYGHAKKWKTEIEKMFSANSVHILQTSPKGKNETAALLRQNAGKLGPRTLFCIVAGDGTLNFVINFLLNDKMLPVTARSTVLLPLWGGNGNDMSTILNGKPDAAKIRKIITDGKIMAVRPLSCKITSGNSASKIYLAANCIGFGATGMMSMQLNSPAHRSGKLLSIPGGTLPQTAVTTWAGLIASSRFEILETGKRVKLYERTYFNGPIFARYYHLPVQLQDDHFYVDTWHAKVPILTPLSALLSMRRRTLRQSKDHFIKKSEFTFMQQAWAQFDGEPLKVRADSKIEIGIHERPFYALSTIIKIEK